MADKKQTLSERIEAVKGTYPAPDVLWGIIKELAERTEPDAPKKPAPSSAPKAPAK
jgi:hypothetical protein